MGMLAIQILAIFGMLSPILYTLMWILGGILRSDYSHIRDDISSLIAVEAPKKRFFDSFIIASSSLLFLFYLGLHWGINNGQGSFLGPILFIVSGFLGVLVALFFPLDAGGEIVTLKGKMHLILVVVSGLLTIAGMVTLWVQLESLEGWSNFATFSLTAAITSSIFMIVAAILIKSKYRGLIERIAVSIFQTFYFGISLTVFLTN